MGFKFIVIVYRLLFALLVIAAVAWQLSERAFGPGFSFVNFFSFFTILSNIFIAVMFLSSVWIGRRSRVVTTLRGAATLYMVITGIVYAVLLAPLEAGGGLTLPWVNTVLHQIMPVVALLDWLLVPPAQKIKKGMLVSWLIFPVAYLAYSLVRGHFIDWYPYPFLNPVSQGYLPVTGYCLGIAIGFVVLGVLLAWTGNHMRAYAKTHPLHYPHFKDSNIPAVDWVDVRKGWMTSLLLIILAVILIIGSWAGWRMWRSNQIDTTQQISTTKNPDVYLQSETYQGQFFQGKANYVLINNQKIDDDIRRVVDSKFQPCRRAGVDRRHEPAQVCQAIFKVLYETPNYFAVTYTFKDNAGTVKLNLLYDRKSGEQIQTKDLFKGDSEYLKILSAAAQDSLHKQFGKYYKKDLNLKAALKQNLVAKPENFANFLLTKDEQLFIYYEPGQVAPQDKGVVRAMIDKNSVFGILKPQVVDHFFPKFKKHKEEERRQAEAARASAQTAEVARQHTRSLVSANRSNINCAHMKCISLTFDDGPGAYTNQVLDMLRARKAVASFFVLGGSASRNGGMLQRMVREKNEVANHTWSHPDLRGLSNQHIADEIELTNHAIHAAIGVYPKLMRPPYGAYNDRVIAHVGMPIAMWSIDTNDWKRPGSGAICQRATGNASPGAVILMHDIHADTVAAVPCIIDELQRQGYVLVTMSELFGIDSSNVKSYSGHVLYRR
jgi:peptidoglycan-N-acetylglucosamine deacetylase